MSDKEIVLNMGTNSVGGEIGDPYKWVKEDDQTKSILDFYQNKPFTLPVNPSRDTIFHVAAYMGSLKSLQALFDEVPGYLKKEVLMKKNIYGNTLLHELAAANKANYPKEEKKKINIQLEPAAENKVRVQKEKNRPNQEPTPAVNALKFLKDNTRSISVEMLGIRNHMGETPLYRAAAYGNEDIVQWLVKEVGDNVDDHFRRNDGLPILQVAVMNDHFEVALWLLEKYPETAKMRDSENKTCLHLLATMPTAFKSSTKMTAWKTTVYSLIPDDLISKDIAKENVEIYSSSHSHSHSNETSNRYKICFSNFCEGIKGWEYISKVRELKKKHCLAVALVKELVKRDDDSSWFDSNRANENETICFLKYDGVAVKDEDKKETKQQKSKRGGAPMASDTPLITASWSGILEIVDAILEVYPQAIEHVNKNGQNILHVTVLNRHVKIFERIKEVDQLTVRRLALGIDNDGDTVLHKAGYITYYTGGTKSTAALKLEEEIQWFHDVMDLCPKHYTIHRNKNNITAEELFKTEHEVVLLKEAQDWVKNACQSCSTVAILVATVLYTVAFQVPGGYSSGGGTKEPVGHPILEAKPLYSFFLVMDVSGLAMSLTSVAIFLSILTSPLDQKFFLSTIPRKLTLGIVFLFFSIATTIFSFMATILLTVTLKASGTMVLNFVAALTPITIYLVMQYDLYYEYITSAFISNKNWAKKYLPKIYWHCGVSS